MVRIVAADIRFPDLLARRWHAELTHLSIQVGSMQAQSCSRVGHVATTSVDRSVDVLDLKLPRRVTQRPGNLGLRSRQSSR